MATTTPEPFAGFNAQHLSLITRLGSFLKLLGPVFLIVGGLRIALALAEVFRGQFAGVLILPEGALLAFAGLASIAAATDTGYLATVKGREKEHLVNKMRSINAACVALLILGIYLALVQLLGLFIAVG